MWDRLAALLPPPGGEAVIRRRVLYMFGGWSRTHLWRPSADMCCCGKFNRLDAVAADPPRGWPVSKRCERARRKKR